MAEQALPAMGSTTCQDYVSEELTHFVGRRKSTDEDRYQLLVEILRTGWLKYSPEAPDRRRGPGLKAKPRNVDLTSNEAATPWCVCFCDIPLRQLGIHMGKYSQFGVAFKKERLAQRGARPVFYIPHEMVVIDEEILDEIAVDPRLVLRPERIRLKDFLDKMLMPLYSKLAHSAEGTRGHLALQDREDVGVFLGLFAEHFLSFIKCFDHRLSDDDEKNYYMEREWRTLDNVHFDLADVCRVIVPRAFVGRLESDVPKYTQEVIKAEDLL